LASQDAFGFKVILEIGYLGFAVKVNLKNILTPFYWTGNLPWEKL